MDKNLKKKELMALGVHDLRNIARTVGVVGPTMKVKEQLIEEIVNIMSGDMQANGGVKRGRKAKANFLTGEAAMSLPIELSAILQAKEQKQHSIFGGNMGYLALNQNSVSALVELVEKQGFLLCENDVFYFFDISQQKSMVYVPAQLCEKFALKIGDKVVVKCQKMPGNNIYLGKEVIKINDIESQKYKRHFCQFDDFAHSSTKWFCDEITEGDLKIVSAKNVKEFLKAKNQLFYYCKQNNIFVLFLDIDFSIKEQEEVENIIKNSEIIHTYSDDPENCFESLINIVNNAIIRTQSGQKVLVVMFNFAKILSNLEKLTKLTSLSNKDIKNMVSKIQNLNRILSNNASLTTIVVNV